MSKVEKQIAVPVPEDADVRTEAAIVANHPEFKRLVERGREERLAGRRGRSHEEVWAALEDDQATDDDVPSVAATPGTPRT